MTPQNLGYQYLIARYELPARPLAVACVIDSAPKTTRVQRDLKSPDSRRGHQEFRVFGPAYAPKDTLVAHLQFALRYEGIHLEVLALLFEKVGAKELQSWLADAPESIYARRAGFLYEWLNLGKLTIKLSSKARYVRVLDTSLQFGYDDGPRNGKFRVIDNLPGGPKFCPWVRRTEFLQSMVNEDFARKIRLTLKQYDPVLLRRAADFLYLKETQSSFEVERERPSIQRTDRFVELLRQADTRQPLNEKRLIDLQNAVVDPRFHEAGWRNRQNWIGRDIGYHRQVDFVPPRPEDVMALMSGLLEAAGRAENHLAEDTESESGQAMDPVVIAAMISFGFVFIHPFMDGNGRIHRYLIHEILAKAGFTPQGMVLPVSAVILAGLREYVDALEIFSRPMMARTEFDPSSPEIPAKGNESVYFRFFDCTAQAEFLYKALKRTVEEDLNKELDFLLGFDQARKALNASLDWPGQSLDLFIRCVHQNQGRLSKAKRTEYFKWMSDEEIAAAETQVFEAFGGKFQSP